MEILEILDILEIPEILHTLEMLEILEIFLEIFETLEVPGNLSGDHENPGDPGNLNKFPITRTLMAGWLQPSWLAGWLADPGS